MLLGLGLAQAAKPGRLSLSIFQVVRNLRTYPSSMLVESIIHLVCCMSAGVCDISIEELVGIYQHEMVGLKTGQAQREYP
jgi:hypothetical protein